MCGQDSSPSRGSKGVVLPRLFHLLATVSLHWLVAASFSALPLMVFSLCLSLILLCFFLISVHMLVFSATDDPELFSHLKIFNLVLLAETF